MYTISNDQMRRVIRYVEKYRESVHVATCGVREYNDYRLAGNLLRRLREKVAQHKDNKATQHTTTPPNDMSRKPL